MKFLKTFLIVVAVLLSLLLIVSVFMPSTFDVKREIIIDAPMPVVFNQVNDFNEMQNWSPWKDYDPQMKLTIEGEPGKAGYKYSWKSSDKNVGSGSLTRLSTEDGKAITNTLTFEDFEMKSTNYWTFEPAGDGVKVVWGDKGDVPFMARIFFALKNPDKMMGPDFEKGLNRMKEYCEKNKTPKVSDDIKIEVTQTSDINYMAVREKADTSNIGPMLGKCYGMIGAVLKKQKLEMAGPVFAIYYSESSTNFDFDAAVQVNQAGKEDGNVKPGLLKATKAVVAHHFGPYENTPAAHEAIGKYISENHLKITGPVWEVYVNDPMTVKNPSEIQTDIYYGVE